jgi:serine/threonine protein kinase
MCDHEGKTVKITDFNVSKFCTQSEKFYSLEMREIDIKMCTNTGTLQYKAPEMLSERSVGYNQTVDMWSAGMTLYQMLSNTVAFHSSYL